MPAHKQQHFVPRCLLRPFSHGGEGRAVNLVGVDGRLVRNAPLKGQCSRDYFYGRDTVLEKLLQPVEGRYAGLVKRLVDGDRSMGDSELRALREFSFLQLHRTERAVERGAELLHEYLDKTFTGQRAEKRPQASELPDDHALLMMSMSHNARGLPYISDLKTVVVENHSRTDFIVSDDPAILTNRFVLAALGKSTFGFASAGAMLLMPLSPRLLLLSFDAKVYEALGRRGFIVPLERPSDANALNQTQYLNASLNVYFSDWADGPRIAAETERALARKPGSSSGAAVFVPDGLDEVSEAYRRASPTEVESAPVTLTVTSRRYPRPGSWPTFLTVKRRPEFYDNGSALGPLRRIEWFSRENPPEPPR